MNGFMMILVGLGTAIAGGRIGLRRLMYITVAAIACFASVTAIREFFTSLSAQFKAFMPPDVSNVLSFIILALVPAITIGYFGRQLIEWLKLIDISDDVGAVLGGGYMLAAFTAFMYVI